MPIDPYSQSPEGALRIIGRQVDEDFLFLLPSGPEEQLVLEAYIACFPAGFSWTGNRGKLLAEIHQPVPDYKKKLQLSMDHFLRRLEPGKFVNRLNVSLQLRLEAMLKVCCCGTDDGTVVHIPTDELFALQDLHNYGGHEEELTLGNFDPCKVCNRTVIEMILPIIRFIQGLSSLRKTNLTSTTKIWSYCLHDQDVHVSARFHQSRRSRKSARRSRRWAPKWKLAHDGRVQECCQLGEGCPRLLEVGELTELAGVRGRRYGPISHH